MCFLVSRTQITTAVAFFATAICPVAALKLFAIFNGLLITFDYIMCCVLVFPALCLYDRWSVEGCCGCCFSCCISWNCFKKNKHRRDADVGDEEDSHGPKDEIAEAHRDQGIADDNDNKDVDIEPQSLIRRVLTAYYTGLHKIRWVLLVASVAAFVVSTVFALRLELPQSSDVRVLSNSNEYERNFEWRKQLLLNDVMSTEGSDAIVIWGVKAADTGDHNNPSK